MHTLPKLNYALDALEPYFDRETMAIHYGKHHQTYVDKLNAALVAYPDLAEKPVDDLLRDLAAVPEAIQKAVRNFGGGHANHRFFWSILRPAPAVTGENLPAGNLTTAIDQTFGDFEAFKQTFTTVATGLFGSGWCWLVSDPTDSALKIITTPNQDSPLTLGLVPLLALDLWEHAYYLKYQNRRPEFVEAAWSLYDWEKINSLLK